MCLVLFYLDVKAHTLEMFKNNYFYKGSKTFKKNEKYL